MFLIKNDFLRFHDNVWFKMKQPFSFNVEIHEKTKFINFIPDYGALE